MQEWGLEYKNVEYYSFSLKKWLKKKQKMRNGARKLKIKSHTEKNNIFKKFSPLEVYRIFLLVGVGRKCTTCFHL